MVMDFGVRVPCSENACRPHPACTRHTSWSGSMHLCMYIRDLLQSCNWSCAAENSLIIPCH